MMILRLRRAVSCLWCSFLSLYLRCIRLSSSLSESTSSSTSRPRVLLCGKLSRPERAHELDLLEVSLNYRSSLNRGSLFTRSLETYERMFSRSDRSPVIIDDC
jgi:hypothetical protein